MKKRMLLIGLVVLILAAIGFQLASNKKKLDEKKKPEAEAHLVIPVNIATATRHDAANSLIKTGTLIPFKEADIMAASSGKLTSVRFELGSYVSQGAVVAQVDNKGLQLSLEAAQLAKEKADKDFKRYKTLLEGEATTEVNFQDAKLNAQNSANQIEQIQKQMADNRIKAPISGQVVSKLVEAGEYVNPGTILGHVVNIDQLKVNVMVSESDVYTLKPGSKVNITTDIYPGVTFDGRITFISGQGDATHNYLVEIALRNRKDYRLKAGTFASVDFDRKSKEPLLLIPRTALIATMKSPSVYVVENGKAVQRTVSVGRDIGNRIEILDGLKEGDQVVVSGQINLSDGASVRAIAQK